MLQSEHMNPGLREKLHALEARRAEIDAIAMTLSSEHITVIPEKDSELGGFGYRATFSFQPSDTSVTIGFRLYDHQSGADLVITNTTTLPENQQGKGYGKEAVHELVVWARGKGLQNITATQVQEESRGFWEKLGFAPKQGSPTKDFIL